MGEASVRLWRKDINIIKTLVTILLAAVMSSGCGYESAFRKTDTGTIEIKTIPESMVLTTVSEGDYFSEADDMFMQLFDYIKKNDIPMTIPVEAGLHGSRMTFYAGKPVRDRQLEDEGRVRVSRVTERVVASIGKRGGYNRKNVDAAEKELTDWIEEHAEYSAIDSSYAVFWNAPFTPDLLKRYEVHIPVEKTNGQNQGGINK